MSQRRITLPISFATHYGADEQVDPWELRTRFLKTPAGQWMEYREWLEPYLPDRRRKVTEKDFLEWQQLITKALVLHPREWIGMGTEFDHHKSVEFIKALTLEFRWDGDVPTGIILRATGLKAVVMSVQIDKLQGAEFRVCARPDCHEPPFKVEARQKEYCSYDCAHLMAVRRSRARKAKLSKTGQRNTVRVKGRK